MVLDVWKLSELEYKILVAMSDSEFGMNAYNIQKALASVIYEELEHYIKYHPKRSAEYKKEMFSVYAILENGWAHVTTKQMREVEKILRHYEDMPTYDRLVRMLKNLEEEGIVSRREVGDKEIIWGISPDMKEKIRAFRKKKEKKPTS